jgi:hypothetical protein
MKKSKKQSSKVQDNYFKNQHNTKIRKEYTDLDYIHKLDNTKKNCKLPTGQMVTEFEYMKIFMKEWNNADVGAQSNAKQNKFHRTAKRVKECTDRNNQRNADQYGRAKAHGMVNNIPNENLKDLIERNIDTSVNHVEDALIDFLDESKKLDDTTGNGDK